MTLQIHIAARFGRFYIDVDRLRSGHHLAEDALTRHDTRVDTWYRENVARDPDDSQFLAFLHAEQKDDSVNGYPQLLRSALFTAGYGLLELFMLGLCKELEKVLSGKPVRQFRDEGIFRAKGYLGKVGRIEFPASEEWERLTQYGKLRNLLVHAQGNANDHPSLPPITQLMTKVRTFAFTDDSSSVILSKDFNPKFLINLDDFAGQLDKALEPLLAIT